MNETRRKPTTGRQSPSLFDKWHGIFYMLSLTDTAGHTKAFDYPVAEHWGKSRNVHFRGWDSNRRHIGPESSALQDVGNARLSVTFSILHDFHFCPSQSIPLYTSVSYINCYTVSLIQDFHIHILYTSPRLLHILYILFILLTTYRPM